MRDEVLGRVASTAAGASAVALSCVLCAMFALRADSPAGLTAAQGQFKSGNYSAAVTSLQAIVARDASPAEAYYWLGRCYYELRDYNNAVTAGEKAVTLDAKNSLYHQWLGREYGGKADREHSFSAAKDVKKEFQEAVRLNPSNIEARRDLEEFELDAPWIVGGNKDDAQAQVEAIAAVDPVQGHLARGLYDRSTKKMEQAQAEYRQVVNGKAPADAYFEAAEFFEREKMPGDVDAAIQAAAKVNANDARLAFHRGVQAVLANGDLANAERDLKSYLANSPDRSDWPGHAAAREWLGRLYESQGKNGPAAEQYRAALQLDPDRKEAKQRLEKLGKAN